MTDYCTIYQDYTGWRLAGQRGQHHFDWGMIDKEQAETIGRRLLGIGDQFNYSAVDGINADREMSI